MHLHEEETVILPELQRLYTDDELCKAEFSTYRVMSADDLAHMMKILFPHMNISDKEVFLADIKACDSKKFIDAWNGIEATLDSREKDILAHKLGIE